jgi:hypothetical protein
VNNVDRDLGYLISPRAGRRKSTAEIGEHLTCLGCQVTEPDYIALPVLGLLAGDEYQSASSGSDDLGVSLRGGQVLRIDAFERHGLASCHLADRKPPG